MTSCATCAVEYEEGDLPAVCSICADERQWVPAAGQLWTDLATLRGAGQRLTWARAEPGRIEITADPKLGIGQTAQLVHAPGGQLLWDPPGFIDEETVTRIRELGPVLAVAASHPHMFGVQTEWGAALEAPVLVCEPDAQWLGRSSAQVQFWDGDLEVAAGLSLHRVGGHFPGAAVALWASGRGVLLSGDTVFPNPDRSSVGFMRSYPNKIPLSAAVVERIATRLAPLTFDRIIGNFGNAIDSGAHLAVQRSAERHAAWVRGEHDEET